MKVSEATFKTCVFTLKVKTGLAPAFHDITDSVAEFVKQSELRNAFALVFSKHTTAAITIQENEPLLLTDMASTLERFAPFAPCICTRTSALTVNRTASIWCWAPARQCR